MTNLNTSDVQTSGMGTQWKFSPDIRYV